MIVAGNGRHAKQCLAIGAALPDARAKLTLMGQKRRALHEEHGKRRHPDVGHREPRVQPPPLVRQAGAGLPNQSKQISQNRHMKLESETHATRKPRRAKTPPMAKMRIAARRAVKLTRGDAGYSLRTIAKAAPKRGARRSLRARNMTRSVLYFTYEDN